MDWSDFFFLEKEGYSEKQLKDQLSIRGQFIELAKFISDMTVSGRASNLCFEKLRESYWYAIGAIKE